MKFLIVGFLGLFLASSVFAETGVVVGGLATTSTAGEVKSVCETASKDEKNKDYSVGGRIDGNSHGCSFRRFNGREYCEGLGGIFKRGFFSAGTCSIGNPE